MKKIMSVFTACVILMTLLGGCAESVRQPSATESTAAARQDAVEAQTEPVLPPSVVENADMTPSDVIDAAEEIELTQAERFGLPTEKIGQRTISCREFMELSDVFVGFAAPEKLDEWKNEFKSTRKVDEPISRYDAVAVLYHAGQLVGGGYAEGGDMNAWTAYYINASYFDQITEDPNSPHYIGDYEFDQNGEWLGMNFYGYLFSHTSKISGRNLFYCNPDNCSFDMYDYPSYADGVLAILRLIGSVQPELFDQDLFPFDKPDPGIFNDELYEKIALYPDLTVDTLPRWTGLVFTGTADYYTDQISLLRYAKEWGYNAVRIFLLPSAYDDKWEKLDDKRYMLVMDQMIAEAIKIGMHVEICCNVLPGFWGDIRGEAGGYDGLGVMSYYMDCLYGDKHYQDLADEIWRTVATRYIDVPSAVLTMLPMQEMYYKDSWYEETTIHNEYTPQDVADYQSHIVDVIHEVDPDRIVVFEPLYEDSQFDKVSRPVIEAMKGKPNTVITYNYPGAGTWGYFALTQGTPDPDNYHHSTPVQPYPFYPYEAHDQVVREYPIKIGGFLPAGTQITLNVKKFECDESILKPLGYDGAEFRVLADGEVLYSEKFTPSEYAVGDTISYFMSYAESEKQIVVTLPKDTESVIMDIGSDLEYTWPHDSYDNGVRLYWSGLKIRLPDEYAVDQLWNASQYDITLGIADTDKPGLYMKHTSEILVPVRMGDLHYFNGTHDITVYKDVTYSTPYITGESDRETVTEYINGYVEKCNGWPGSIRLESFFGYSGERWEDYERFLTDNYDALTENGFSWWCNDLFYSNFSDAFVNQTMYGIEPTEYGRYPTFYKEVPELLQKYMAPGWCEFSAEADGKGSVSGSQMIIAGSSATLTAVPDDGAEFLGWYLDGELVSSEPSYTVEVGTDTKLVAKFTPSTMSDGADSAED